MESRLVQASALQGRLLANWAASEVGAGRSVIQMEEFLEAVATTRIRGLAG